MVTEAETRILVPELPTTSDTPLEDAVVMLHEEEKARKEGNGEKDYQRVHIRLAINEQASSVKVIIPLLNRKLHLAITQATLTRCMARHSLHLCNSILRLPELNGSYNEVFMMAKNGHTALRKQMQQSNFEPLATPEPVNVLWDIPNFVMRDYGRFMDSTGIPVRTLMVYGMAWVLTTLENRMWDKYNIETYFKPEIRHLAKMIEYRKIDIDSFRRKMELDGTFVPNL